MALKNGIGMKSDDAWSRPAFIAWKSYQRRAEVLAPLLGCPGVRYFPHFFLSSALRPLDYLSELLQTLIYLVRSKPTIAILQAPPLIHAFAAILARNSYVVDIHNTLMQSFWRRVTLTGMFIRHAAALIAHNSEIASVIQAQFPAAKVVTIPDPVEVIGKEWHSRDTREIVIICSFDRDEPISLFLDIIRAHSEFSFTITANIKRLPRRLRRAFEACTNLRLTGFLNRADYHSLLCSSKAAIVLCTLPSVQPCGGVEALASNTPLIVTKSSLTESLFGDWAILVGNNLESLTTAIRSLNDDRKDLRLYREQWNEGVRCGIAELKKVLEDCPDLETLSTAPGGASPRPERIHVGD